MRNQTSGDEDLGGWAATAGEAHLREHRRLGRAIGAGLFALVVLLYAPVARFEFTAGGDDDCVYENATVLRGLTAPGLHYALTPHAGRWQPLTWLSHMLDCELFALQQDGAARLLPVSVLVEGLDLMPRDAVDGPTGADFIADQPVTRRTRRQIAAQNGWQWPGGHHLVNVVLHALAAIALFAALRRMAGVVWPSAVVAALFALHPLHVESVAWVARRQDVLGGLCLMLTLRAYAGYAARPTIGRYGLWLLGALAALLANPILVTLPLVLLLLDCWPLRRWQKVVISRELMLPSRSWSQLVLEKVPLLLMAAAASAIALAGLRSGDAVVDSIPFAARAANAAAACLGYLVGTLQPADLAVFYPHPYLQADHTVTAALLLRAGLAGFAMLLITVVSWRTARNHPWLLLGWSWFLVTLAPVLGLVPIDTEAMADRHTYVPLVGLFVLAVFGLYRVPEDWRPSPRQFKFATATVLAVATVITVAQTRHWRNSLTLFGHAAAVVPDNYLALDQLGFAYQRLGALRSAENALDRSLAIEPDYDSANNHRAVCYLAEGDLQAAEVLLRRALAKNPRHRDALHNLATVCLRHKRYDEAAASCEQAIELGSERLDDRLNLAFAWQQLGRLDEAARTYREVLVTDPGQVSAACRLYLVLALQGRLDDASEGLQRLLAEAPDLAEAHWVMATVHRHAHAPGLAEAALRRAVHFDPGLDDARHDLAALLAARGQLDEATLQFEELLRRDPRNADAHNDLAVVKSRRQDEAGAREHLEAALRSEPGHAAARRNLDTLQAGGSPAQVTR